MRPGHYQCLQPHLAPPLLPSASCLKPRQGASHWACLDRGVARSPLASNSRADQPSPLRESALRVLTDPRKSSTNSTFEGNPNSTWAGCHRRRFAALRRHRFPLSPPHLAARVEGSLLSLCQLGRPGMPRGQLDSLEADGDKEGLESWVIESIGGGWVAPTGVRGQWRSKW